MKLKQYLFLFTSFLLRGLKSGEAVLKTIRTAHISESSSAKLALFKGLIRRKDLKEFKKAKEDFPLSLTEYEFLDFIQELGLNGQDSWLEEVSLI